MDRIKKLCSYLQPCTTFADVACDHGYCAQYMLKNRLCESAVISDISAKSLSKAENLLSDYIAEGKCRSVCCDGLTLIPKDTEQVLIAGIGGEEIIKILKTSYIPKNFVFQPMKNAPALRKFLLQSGCKINKDDIFTDGKNYYFVICGANSGDNGKYSAAQFEYGKDSLNNCVLKEYLKEELSKRQSYLSGNMTEESRSTILKSIQEINSVLNEIN
ncbi:MAG: class I SAM-dependent methyltransferase [Clostridia bacterium]|nr:class I SAM-dependent methyltransferase [Clostridia bacterium]